MKGKLRLFTRRFFIYCNILVVIFFLLACLAPYLDPAGWWFISILGLFFPFLLLLVILFLTGWLFTVRRYAVISGMALLISFKSISVFFAFGGVNAKFSEEKKTGHLRIVSWNVARFIEIKKNNNKGSQDRLKMMQLLKEQDADILCLQEFQTSALPEYYDNLSYVQKELGYPYFFFTFDEDGSFQYYSSIIFSRYPVIDSGRVRYPRPTLPDALIYADIKVNHDTIRVFNTHLQSLQFRKRDYERLDKIKRIEDSILYHSRSIGSKIKRGLIRRSIQADIINKVLDDSPYPVLFCADLNDVPNSYTYFTVKGNMQDAFLRKGFGIGRTFAGLSPTLRIDYILADRQFRIGQFKRVEKDLSDHYMLVADVELKISKPD
jgi:endonuclease/exonuclease/phosphatase family metal-dependent hydrolase